MLITASIGLFFNLVNMTVLNFCFNPKEEDEKDED